MGSLAATSAKLAPGQGDSGPRAFASARSMTRQELLGARLRWPRPSRLQVRLEVASGKTADGLLALGLTSVGALLEHLPSDSREARTVEGLAPGEGATVAVEVRAIGARPVRRRGMKPLVEALVFDETGSMRAMFFNQPWLATRYKPGTRLVLHGKLITRGKFNVAHHAIARDAEPPGQTGATGEPRRGRALSRDGGRQLDADSDADARRAGRAGGRAGGAGGSDQGRRAPARPGGRAGRDAFSPRRR